ncbi:hypothetical protein F8388_012465 [Cannabis sativa]|uniref:High mobility group B protein 9 n=1 Tax=Cannabis sativa TaxID=3483 RepID=A0A7J6F9G8_CANSA|nr:hypothetical protein G4B88_023878 [Cannabis sativa]KAF4388488.1 hypothetical protein F8388_012465 [Cannabis sativa]
MSPVDTNKGWNGVQDMNYPTPLASHDDVAKDPIVFWDTLRRFHFLMNTKFMVPVIGGKELDLHILYVEVTRRGGFEKVVAEKKWREVGTIFMFSPTTTSASFVLRKHYISLLYHYEQVHFFRMQGPLCSPSVTFPVCSRSFKPELAIVEYSPKSINDFPMNQDIEEEEGCGTSGSPVVAEPNNNAIVPYTGKPRHSRRRKRKSKRRGDPNYPKPNRSGYNFFFAEKHYKLKSLFPNREREFTKMIGESWTNLSPEERTVYQNIGLKDKERYRRELKEYKESIKLRQQTVETS